MNTLHANGITLAYDSFGDERDDTLLLIAGLGTQMLRWSDDFCGTLAGTGLRVIRYDNRDAGLSTHFDHCPAPDLAALVQALAAGQTPRVPYTLHDMAADAVGLLDALSIERAHVVGRSMGGMIAQLLAADHPQRVRSLTAIMSSTGNRALPQAAPEVMALMTRPAPHPRDDEAGYLAHALAFAERIASPGVPFDAAAQRAVIQQECRRAHDPAGTARQIAAIAATGDLRPKLAQVRMPTLVVHGSDDVLIPPACGEDIAANITGAERLHIDGMGHDLPPVLHARVIAAIHALVQRSHRGS